jgi:hypothetical protein
MKTRPQSGATPLRSRSSRDRVARSRHSEESGFAFLMALGMMLILLAASLVILQNFVTEGKRTQEEETIWRGEQYARAVRLYYHKMGHYPQTMDDLQKGGLQLHFLRQAYKNPMNKTDGTWRFIYVNAAGQIIGSVRYATLQQMVLIDQYAGLLPGAAPTSPMPGQIGVSAASLVSGSGSGANSQQLQSVLSGILSSVPSNPDTGNGATSSQPQSDTSQSGTAQSGTLQSGSPASSSNQLNGQLPPGISPDQVTQLVQSGQLPPGITPDMVTAYLQSGQLPPGITQDQVNQFTQNLQNPQSQQNPQTPDNSQNPQNPAQSSQSSFGPAPSGQSGPLSFGSSSATQPGQSGAAVNPLLLMKPTGPVDGPVLGGFLTGVACTTDIKSIKVYRRGKKYQEWEFIWNPLEDALAAAQQTMGSPQGVLGPGQTGGAPASGTPGGGMGGNGSNPFGNSPMPPTSPGPQQPPTQQPQ